MKPGFTTSEFWIACGVQITALITALGSDDPMSKIMAGATALGAVLCYLYHRYALKSAAQDKTLYGPGYAGGPVPIDTKIDGPLLPLIAFALLLFLGGDLQAQHVKPRCECPPTCCPGGCDCGCGVTKTHAHGFGFRLNLWIAPRPVVVVPPPVVAPVQIVYVDPAHPVYPLSPVFVIAGPPPVYYQFIPQVYR